MSEEFINYIIKNKIKIDAITILGTLCTTSNYEEFLDQCLRLNPKIIIINDYFNSHGIDIKCGYRLSGDEGCDFNFGFNILSIETITSYVNKNNLICCIDKYKMNTKIEKGSDPLHSWHVECDGREVLTNGTNLILEGFNIIIHTKKND